MILHQEGAHRFDILIGLDAHGLVDPGHYIAADPAADSPRGPLPAIVTEVLNGLLELICYENTAFPSKWVMVFISVASR